MAYRFRLTVASRMSGLFRCEESQTSFTVDDKTKISLVARDARTLSSATKFHFEGTGFPTETDARNAGEQLRLRLRILNARMGLGLSIPKSDSVSGQLAKPIKDKMREQHGAIVVDSVWGLSVFPDDDKHFEFVVAGRIENATDPGWIFEAVKGLWCIEVRLDQASEDALHLLNLAAIETSDRAAFLTA